MQCYSNEITTAAQWSYGAIVVTDNLDKNQVPNYRELFNPTLKAIRNLGDSTTIAEITNQVIEDLNLPHQATQVPHGRGSQTELEYRLGWARTYLKKYGLILNSERGIWSLTASGRDIDHVDPGKVVDFIRQQPNQAKQTNEAESWREILSDTLLNLSPDTFERLCQRLLRESGVIEVRVTGRSSDSGIDGHGIIRFGRLIGFSVMFQCKRYTHNVTASEVRDFRGAMQGGRTDRGLILTTGGFTCEAHREATRDGAPPIDLIDGELLMDKLKELKLGVNVEMVEEVRIDTN